MSKRFNFSKTWLVLVVLFLTGSVFAQVGINTIAPNATFDVSVNTKITSLPSGIIAPRVSLSYLINNETLYTEKQTGSIVYVDDIDVATNVEAKSSSIIAPGYYYYNGNHWVLFVVPDVVKIPSEPWYVNGTSTEATQNNQDITQNARVGIGINKPIDPNAQLEIYSDDKGILIPRLTQVQIDAMTNLTESLMVWNIDKSCFNFIKQGKWKSLCGDIGESKLIISPPDCASATVNGTYQVGTPINNGNYIEIGIQVIEAGTYSILAKTSAGFFFQTSGTFPSTGYFLLQVPGIGAPNRSGVVDVDIFMNGEQVTAACKKTVNVDPAAVKFEFVGSGTGDDVTEGESTAGKTIKVRVNVTNPGTFNFSSDNVNGYMYLASNLNLQAGPQDVILNANGNPPNAYGDFTYNISGTGITGTPLAVTIKSNQSVATISSIDCSGSTIGGTYKLDTPLTVSHFIKIAITSTKSGSYSLTMTNAENPGFSYSASGYLNAGTNTITAYATGTPTKAGSIPFTVTVNGVTCTRNVTVVIPQKSILLAGGPSATIRAALVNTANFGPDGKTKIEGFQFHTETTPTAAQLKTYINTNNVAVIIIGWSWNPSEEITNILSDFVLNKNGFVFWVQSQGDQAYMKKFLDKTYGTNVTMTADAYSVYTAKFDNSDATNPYLNGVFGDARENKYMRVDDYGSHMGIVPSTLGSLKGLIKYPANGGEVARVSEIYAKGFFMYSDWGSLAYTGGQYGFNTPIAFGSVALNGYNSTDGTTLGPANIPGDAIANWVVFGNAMDYILNYVQNNYIQSYKVQ